MTYIEEFLVGQLKLHLRRLFCWSSHTFKRWRSKDGTQCPSPNYVGRDHHGVALSGLMRAGGISFIAGTHPI